MSKVDYQNKVLPKYLHLCSENERKSYGFGTTLINDRNYIFEHANPLTFTLGSI